MKRFVWIVLIILTSMSVIACSKDEDSMSVNDTSATETSEDSKEESKEEVIEDSKEEKDTKEAEVSEEDKENKATYEIKDEVYEKGKIIIHYPQIVGLEDKSKQEQINKLILADAMKDTEEFAAEDATLEINYEVSWKGENLLSIKYIVYSSYPGAAHPNHSFYSTNINIPQATRIRLKDMVEINDSFVAAFIADSSYTEPLREANGELSDMLEDDLKALSTAGLMGADSATDYTPYYSYYTENSLGIGIEVAFVVGGYAIYEIPYEKLLPYIPSKQEAWRDFPELLSDKEQSGDVKNDNQSTDIADQAEEAFLPIVVQDLLLGSYDGEKWIDLEGTLPRLYGGETYQLFANNKPIGSMKGKAPALDVDFQNFYMVEMEASEADYAIAIGTENKLNYAKIRRGNHSYYEKLVLDYFEEIGHPEYTLGSLEGYSYDFDRDGAEEDIILAYQYLDQFYYEVPAEGCYSYQFYHDNGSMKVIQEAYRSTVDEETLSYLEYLEVEVGDEIIIASRPAFLGAIDITGDGICELIVEDYGYESWCFEVLELKEDNYRMVLGEGFGV